ncbi:MAG TPA: hypothetical protein VJU86_21085 [Pyrinomonadaceae bacterium]|nr:hypothetical protein [Pyrinomonadaceae bacterium]
MNKNKSVREYLLASIPFFVQRAARLEGVRRIGLVGSILTNKQNPKDIDFLLTVDDEVDLEPLARLGRKVKGAAQQINHGADIFLRNAEGMYIGRTCHWRECGWGRVRCDALNCGKRLYLHDDLNAVALSEETMLSSMELWPKLEHREGLPTDLGNVIARLGHDPQNHT